MPSPVKSHSGWRKILLALSGWAAGAAAFFLSLWAFGALWYDFPFASRTVAVVYVLTALAAVFLTHGKAAKFLTLFGLTAVVMIWWFSQKPRHDRVWQPDVAELPWAEIKGDEIVLHNLRNCDYRTETDYTPRWETRTVRLSQLTGVDLFINYWGSPWMAHPIASFQFADAPPVCFSIETRKEEGESYSAIGGLYRQYELICIAADERDVVRLRTNYRQGEESYLYRTRITPERARERFLEYVNTINSLRSKPRWYNAITTNCTTAIRSQHPAGERLPWDWRILVNGKGDEMLYEQHAIVSDGLPFAELRKNALINSAAKSADQSPDFSRLIREGRPGLTVPAPVSK